MKRSLPFFFLLMACMASAQKKQVSIEAYTSFLNGGKSYDGGDWMRTYHTKPVGAVVAGVGFSKNLSRWLKISTGLEYANRTFETINIEPVISISATWTAPRTYYSREHMQLLSVPVSVQADLFQYFFISTGILFDLDMGNAQIGRQSGVGAQAGLGVKYDLKAKPINFFVQPYIQAHGLLKFTESQQRMQNTGLRVGISYKL